MDNIEELYCYSIKVNLENPETHVVFDYAEGLVCAINDDCLIIYDETDTLETGVIHKINTIGPLRYVKYLTIYNIVFLATDVELMLYDTESRKILARRNTDNSIVELSWNPLETLFVVIDSNNDITSYTTTKNYIDQKDKVELSAKVPMPVLVGWGSQKTQFQGPKHRKSDVSSSEDFYSNPNDPPKISWRGNGELFVVNYYQEDQRFLKVFNNDLNPLNVSEAYMNLQSPVAFMGQGQSIACCAIKNKENQLVIFEKNCKVKAEFDLSEIMGSITKLLYHPLMNILAVGFFDKDDNSFINIYLYSNGEWYLKQQLYYPAERKVHDFHWLNLQENLFTTCKMVVFTCEDVEYHYFRFIINRCPLTGTVVVVNGRNLEFYLFDKKITPPPMYYCSYNHNRTINRVLFHPTKKLCVCIDSYFHVKFLNINEEGGIDDLGIIRGYFFQGIVKYSSIKWGNKTIEFTLANQQGITPIRTKLEDIAIHVKTVQSINDTNILLPFNDTILLDDPKVLDNTSKYIYLTKHDVLQSGMIVEYEFALSAFRELYVNDTPVCSGVTSFYIFEGYLIFTHSSSQLYCIRLKDHILYSSSIHLFKIFSREIEQGASIIACTNLLFPQIILQMPRGNIETIGCKLITIDVVENLLKSNKWFDVIQILRTEKVNWNVLIDLNPERFRSHIEDFVKATKNNTILSNIVTEFNTKENCFQTFYKNYSPYGQSTVQYDKKIIIEDLLKYLVTTDCINNLSSIVAIQQRHISLKSALKSIKDIYEEDKLANDKICIKAIKQLLVQEHFKDVENAAYSLYDLDFLTLVYYNSSEDPKVYEPEIRNFRAMGPMERRFKMSIRGRNIKSSVKYLLRSDTVEESFVTNFIIKNRLEDVAYFSIENYHKQFVLVSHLYANRLSILKKHTEAGMILKRAGMFKEALQEYRKGLDWRDIVGISSLLQLREDESIKIYKDLAADLVKENRLDDAVILLETYCKDYRAAINILIEKNAYRKAISLAEAYREFDMIDQEILPKLSEYMSVLNDKIENYRLQFETYANRLIVVREERSSKLHGIALGQYDDDDDLYSQTETGSHSSGTKITRQTSKSRISSMSSKNRRKEERKKIDLKPGGYYEDIALIRVLYNLYIELFNFGHDVKETCLTCHYNNIFVAKQLHKHLSDLQNDMIKRIPEIWSDVFINETDANEFLVAAVIQNKLDLDPQYRVPPSLQKANSWKLEMFS